jgi:hypothetical protein
VALITDHCLYCFNSFDPPREISVGPAGDISYFYCSFNCFQNHIENMLYSFPSSAIDAVKVIRENGLLEPHFQSPPPSSLDTVIIKRCRTCGCTFHPPRIAAGRFVTGGGQLGSKVIANDLTQYYCSSGCFERELATTVPLEYRHFPRWQDDPSFESKVIKALTGLPEEAQERGLYRLIDEWNSKKQKTIDEGPNISR